MNIRLNKIKNISLISSFVIIIFIILQLLMHGYVLFNYPYQEGGDLLFHTWFSNQILENGSIPQVQPTSNSTSIYSITPLFHILSSSISAVTGLELVYVMIFLNLILVALFILTIYLVANLLFQNKIISLLAAVLFFILNDNLFFYYLPRNLNLILFLILLYLLIKILIQHSTKLKDYILYSLVTTALLFIHHINAAYSITILIGILIITSLFTQKRKKSILLLLAILIAGLIFFGINASSFANNTFPIDTADPSFTINEIQESYLNLSDPLEFIIGSIFWLFTLSGLIYMIYQTARNDRYLLRFIITICWIIIALLILYQAAIGFSYLPSRAIGLLIPILALTTAFGIYTVILFFIKNNRKSSLIILIIIIVITIYPLITNSLSSKHLPIQYGIADENIKELILIKNILPQGIVLSDPVTMYLLTTISGMKPAYNYDHTNLTRNQFINWEEVISAFYNNDKESIQYIQKMQPDYIVISARTRAYFDNTDLSKFDDSEHFTKIYESNLYDTNDYGSSIDTRYSYYSVYQVL